MEGAQEQRQKTREYERKLEALLREFEYQGREAVNAVQDRAAQQKLSKQAEQRMARLRREFQEQFNAGVVAHKTGADRGDPNARPHEVKHVSEGDTVKLKSLGRTALVKRKIDDNTFEVEMGAMKMKIRACRHCRSIRGQRRLTGGSGPGQRHFCFAEQRRSRSAPTEINVIGQTVDQATGEVEKFVDRAFLAGMPRVRIVHGHGMGILRKALRRFLQRHPHVATIAEPPHNEGGAGVTVVRVEGVGYRLKETSQVPQLEFYDPTSRAVIAAMAQSLASQPRP